MAQKEDYVKYVNMAKKLITKYGTEVEIVLGLDPGDSDAPFRITPPDPAEPEKIKSYKTTGVIMPPVRGIYFQGTRFGFHSTFDKDMLRENLEEATHTKEVEKVEKAAAKEEARELKRQLKEQRKLEKKLAKEKRRQERAAAKEAKRKAKEEAKRLAGED